MPTLLHSYPITDPSEGDDILFSVWDCIRPTALCTTSAHMHTQTHTHISAPHQILQLDEEHQWEQWTSGQTMDIASRPACQPRISWLTPQFFFFLFKLTDPSSCTLKNETLVCTRNKGMLGNLTIQASGVGISLQVVEARYQVVCFSRTLWVTGRVCLPQDRAAQSVWHNRA